MMRASGAVAATVAGALVLAACSGGGASTERRTELGVDERAPSSPGGVDRRTTATAADPLRIVVFGDSIAAEVEAAMAAAIGRGPAANVAFVPSPALPRGEALGRWRRQVRASDPDLVVVLVGVWERFSYGSARRKGASRAEYLDLVVDPFAEATTSNGAEVVFVGYRPQPSNPGAGLVARLQAGFSAVADSVGPVAFVDGDVELRTPTGVAAQVVGRAEGVPRRVRRIDGTHLCPAGAVRAAEAVLDHIAVRWDVPVTDGWRDRSWRNRLPFDDPEECPAPA